MMTSANMSYKMHIFMSFIASNIKSVVTIKVKQRNDSLADQVRLYFILFTHGCLMLIFPVLDALAVNLLTYYCFLDLFSNQTNLFLFIILLCIQNGI